MKKEQPTVIKHENLHRAKKRDTCRKTGSSASWKNAKHWHDLKSFLKVSLKLANICKMAACTTG